MTVLLGAHSSDLALRHLQLQPDGAREASGYEWPKRQNSCRSLMPIAKATSNSGRLLLVIRRDLALLGALLLSSPIKRPRPSVPVASLFWFRFPFWLRKRLDLH